MILPVVLYGCGSGPFILREELSLQKFTDVILSTVTAEHALCYEI